MAPRALWRTARRTRGWVVAYLTGCEMGGNSACTGHECRRVDDVWCRRPIRTRATAVLIVLANEYSRDVRCRIASRYPHGVRTALRRRVIEWGHRRAPLLDMDTLHVKTFFAGWSNSVTTVSPERGVFSLAPAGPPHWHNHRSPLERSHTTRSRREMKRPDSRNRW